MLKADHDKVDSLFQQYEEADGQPQQQKTIIEQICKELEVHTAIEEEIFYPAMRKTGQEGKELTSEAVEEHLSIKDSVSRLKGANP
ncbi:MAG: hemerythrin domain-containing protein, partial [Candidatus Binatia bacterium]